MSTKTGRPLAHEDIEVVNAHYRGAHAGSAAKSGFICYVVSEGWSAVAAAADGGPRTRESQRN